MGKWPQKLVPSSSSFFLLALTPFGMSGFHYILALFDLSAPVQKSVGDSNSCVLRYDRKYTALHFFMPAQEVQANRMKLLIMCCCPTLKNSPLTVLHSRGAHSNKCTTHTHTECLIQIHRVPASALPQ
ncbi:hypothetical protein IscW_ISCW000938 [Ixodes scapularis]|uniref:Uncharacterized protein n=1 Tax=Ixodes scapularis TaxID=6945 RepID=B7P2L2_IXOSC|nr:hypothetical protein IscW_ISCW000938 [Ixodes scapularis]|eukprot:XP_002402496.1 hypothetical protein IscW_ISCW000938 [Ixodes scapularis]